MCVYVCVCVYLFVYVSTYLYDLNTESVTEMNDFNIHLCISMCVYV